MNLLPNFLYQDVHEPNEIGTLIRQSAPLVDKMPLNPVYPDWAWLDIQGNTRGIERKQFMECISALDAVEEQLNRELETCDELTLLVEGIGRPTQRGAQSFTMSRDGRFFRPEVELPAPDRKPQPGMWKRWEGLRWSLEHDVGVKVISTFDAETTAFAVSTAYNQSMKTEHTTMKRYVIPHIPPFSPNIQVDNLARLRGTGVGIKLAIKLINHYGNFYEVVTAPLDELEGILGEKITDKFLRGIGRYE